MKKGFTLIELLIVIFIASLLYFLGFDRVDFTQSKKISPIKLKKELISTIGEKNFDFICINKCKKCIILDKESGEINSFEKEPPFKKIKGVYNLDYRNDLHKIEFGRYNDEKICLLIHFYKNGSSSQLIIDTERKSYFLPSFFGKWKEIASIEEGKKEWVSSERQIKDNGVYFGQK